MSLSKSMSSSSNSLSISCSTPSIPVTFRLLTDTIPVIHNIIQSIILITAMIVPTSALFSRLFLNRAIMLQINPGIASIGPQHINDNIDSIKPTRPNVDLAGITGYIGY